MPRQATPIRSVVLLVVICAVAAMLPSRAPAAMSASERTGRAPAPVRPFPGVLPPARRAGPSAARRPVQPVDEPTVERFLAVWAPLWQDADAVRAHVAGSRSPSGHAAFQAMTPVEQRYLTE